MIQSRTTLSEISKALNLSISTVSKSLSDSSEISVITKKRVREFARQCNYVPNHFATSIRRGYTKTIGLIVPTILNPFYAKVLVGIENYLDKSGYKLIISISDESINKESKNLAKMGDGCVDGIIIYTTKETELLNDYSHIELFKRKGKPVIIFDRPNELDNCNTFIVNKATDKVGIEAAKLILQKINNVDINNYRTKLRIDNIS
ncbi:LacI family DNA-binding transcriptional regulator [Winogradskyella thalassocola]|uniref:Regulatory protein, lacI family n=1 Tax=Winogradskyella thalassocola TaxID=262004 RepID=A0A1G7WIZ2_9FLAO|nr:LacI family DNA-binding transcriptional regulator [Winogradskyella thalassocola]SDG71170.1 regulatory protein, lacI family [Winogradskyella thalassocola]